VSAGESRARRWLPAAVVLAAAAAPYLGVLDAPFVFDDVKLVKENRFLREAYEDPSLIIRTFDILDRRWDEEELRPNYRPLRFLSYLGDYALSRWWFGGFPDGSPPVFFFHLTNVVLHALNALLVLVLARRVAGRLLGGDGADGGLGPGGFLALAAALLFALHPLQTEAVTYISGRRDVLSAFFVLAALALHARGDPGRSPRPLASAGVVLLLAAGLLSKETAATLPALLVLLDIALRARWTPGRVALHAVSWALVIAYAAALLSNPRLVAPAGDRDLAGVVLTACRYVARYFGLALLPASQSVDYSYGAIPESTGIVSPWTTLPALLLVLLLAAGGIAGVARRAGAGRLAGAGVLWFLGTLAPVLQFVPIAERFAERFAYLPLAGLVLAAGLLLERARRREPVLGWGLAALLSVAALAASAARNREWRSPLDLWTSAVEAQPRAARAHLGRANALKEAGRLREAAGEYSAAIAIFEERPDVPLHHGSILQALTLRGGVHGLLGAEGGDPSLLDRAVADYRRVLAATDVDGTVIESSPKHAAVHLDLGGFLLQARKLDEARREYRRVIEVGAPAPIAAAAEYYLGKVSLIEGDAPGAVAAMKRALERIPPADPSRARVAIEVSEICLERKDLDGASAVLRAALAGASGADRLHLLYREAKVLDRRGDLSGCLEVLSRILDEDPGYAPALITWAQIDAQAGRLDAAEQRYRKVLDRSPAHAEALQGLRDVAVRRGLKEPPGGQGGEGASGEEVERLLAAIAARGKGHFEKGELFAARDVYVDLLSRARSASSREHQLTALRELAGIADALKLAKDAAGFLEEALALDPKDAASLRQLGDLHLRRLDDREGARRLYERYLEALPAGESADPKVHFNLANIAAGTDPALAIRHAVKAREAGFDPSLVERTLGYLHAEVGAWKESLEAFTRYLETRPSGDEAEREAARRFVNEKVVPRLLERP
jgi:tetratricopeptide (TPR) repeat protein